VTIFQLAVQLRVVLGKHAVHGNWPWMDPKTRAGKIGAVAVHASFVIFCLVGLFASL
jgi:hypothetical protein